MAAEYTPIADLEGIHSSLRETFHSGLTQALAFRRQQLYQLALFARENADAIASCIFTDLGKPKQETIMAEVGPIIERSLLAAKHLEEWVGGEEGEEVKLGGWQKEWKAKVERRAKGVVLIIAPWNYPFILSLQPLYGAISAGCCALIKPSEVVPTFSSFLARTLPQYLDSRAYKVALGGIPEITRILELKWNHIFYTGNARIARIISLAAAKHLTPLTLELGGKSPVLLCPSLSSSSGDPTSPLSLAAKRILWGKINNSGQICVAPDYVLVPRSILPDFIVALKYWYAQFFPDTGGPLESASYGGIVSQGHYERLKAVLGGTNGRIEFGGKYEEGGLKRKWGIEPTLVVDVKEGDSLLEEEIFGPILPIVTVEDVDEAIKFLNERPDPLVLYAFSEDEATKKKILAKTTSGGVCFNDTFQQVSVNELPFGGVGESGHGRQVLKYSFDNFVYERSVLDIPFGDEHLFAPRYPPYTTQSLAFFEGVLGTPIPVLGEKDENQN